MSESHARKLDRYPNQQRFMEALSPNVRKELENYLPVVVLRALTEDIASIGYRMLAVGKEAGAQDTRIAAERAAYDDARARVVADIIEQLQGDSDE